MSNIKKQKRLDKKKWFESEKRGCDMCGQMEYCSACEIKELFGKCATTQMEREINCLCAKAYNRLQYNNKKGK